MENFIFCAVCSRKESVESVYLEMTGTTKDREQVWPTTYVPWKLLSGYANDTSTFPDIEDSTYIYPVQNSETFCNYFLVFEFIPDHHLSL